MTLARGSLLGPYEVIAPLGAGGMGEVYRARDARLGRDVAVKVLPPGFAADGDRLERFEREARAASALSDPHIVAVYDVGTENGLSYIVTELVEGGDLRSVLDRGPLSVRTMLDLALQIAEGLSAAHEKGIVHRDLKPANVLVTGSGLVKIADFGLAKLAGPVPGMSPNLAVAGQSTKAGTIMGTVGYVSPEQAAGLPSDYRSDQFSFGVLVYEMATGKKAFSRSSPVQSLAAVIQDEPDPIGSLNPKVPSPLRWVIERCLAKEPGERYAATRDLARELRSIRDHLSEASTPGALKAPPRSVRRFLRSPVVASGALVAALVFLFLWLHRPRPAQEPRFSRLTFRKGMIASARFTPDGQTIIYGASWDGRPIELYSVRPPAFESRRLDLAPASIFSISSRGEMAISEGCRDIVSPTPACQGTPATVPIDGRTPRKIPGSVVYADWSHDGKVMVVVRRVDERGTKSIEYPPGKVLYRSTGRIGWPRISPSGTLIAFWNEPRNALTGTVSVIDLAGRKRDLSAGWVQCFGLAWSADGREIWFTPRRIGEDGGLWAVSLSGRTRLVYRSPVPIRLHDISANGALLVTLDATTLGINVATPPDFRERDLSWLDLSELNDLSRDGKTVLFQEDGMAAPGMYLRQTDGSDPLPLGRGGGYSISPDGKWVLAMRVDSPDHLLVIPTGSGDDKSLPLGAIDWVRLAGFFPDSSRVMIDGTARGRPGRCFGLSLQGGDPKPLTPEGTKNCVLSLDGKRILAGNDEGRYAEYPVDGGPSRPVEGIGKEEVPIQWGSDDRSVFLVSGAFSLKSTWPVKLSKLDLVTGEKSLIRDLRPTESAGVRDIFVVAITPDGQSYAYAYRKMLSNLFLVEGLK